MIFLAGLYFILLILPIYLIYKYFFVSKIILTINDVLLNDKQSFNFGAAILRFQNCIKFKTVSYETGVYERQNISNFNDYLFESYKLVHNCPWIKWTVINNFSLFYHIISSHEEEHGFQPDKEENKPWLIISHSDVVPIGESDKKLWTHPPFAGEIFDNHIYGRGSLDAKHIICANLECLEKLVESGTRLRQRSIFLTFGHDEEIGGLDGAYHLAKHLTSILCQNHRMSPKLEKRDAQNTDYPLYFILDEGTTIYTDFLPCQQRLALIGVSEKISCFLKLTVKMDCGHSSIPSEHGNAITRLARAVNRLGAYKFNFPHSREALAVESGFLGSIITQFIHRWRQQQITKPNCYIDYIIHMLDHIVTRIIHCCSRLFIKLIGSQMPLVSSIFRTVACVTSFQGGIKNNVVPREAQAEAHIRIHPSQTMSQIIDICKRVIDDDAVQLESHVIVPEIPISPFEQVSDLSKNDTPYTKIAQTINEIFDSTVIAPVIMPGGTDSKHFVDLCHHIYRFSPVLMAKKELAGIHGIDEKICVDSFKRLILWYYKLYENVSGF